MLQLLHVAASSALLNETSIYLSFFLALFAYCSETKGPCCLFGEGELLKSSRCRSVSVEECDLTRREGIVNITAI